MGTPDQGDPFDWTVDQVASYLCHSSPSAWSKSSAPTARPDPVTFEKALQENDVNGEILLTEITKATLHQELGVKSLGQRTSIFNAVQQLRQQSAKYQQHLAASQPTIQPPPPPWSHHLPQGSSSPVGSHFGYFGQTSYTPPPVQNAVGFQTHALPSSTIPPSPFRTIEQPIQPDSPSECSRTDNTGGRFLEIRPKQTEQGGLKTLKRPSVDATQTPNQSTDSVNQAHSTRREHHVVDDRGRKRRRLNLGPPIATQPVQGRYIGRDKISVLDVFYKTPQQDDDEDNFSFTKSGIPTGKQLFVNKLLKHYFLQQPSYLGMEGGKQILGVVPYSRKLVQAGDPQYFTLFTPQDKKILVSQEDVARWPQLHGIPSFGGPMLSDDRDKSLPPLGDSGSEGEYDSDTWNEMEEERQTKDRAAELQNQTEKGPKYLSVSEINTTIDNCLDTFSKNWDSKKLPGENRKARHFWTLSRKQENRKQHILNAKNTIEHLRKRLDKIRERIHDERWTKTTELQTQCQSMEPSVSDMKKEEWKISILELSTCPPRPPRETVPPKRIKKPAMLNPEDEESLDSESEDEFDDNMEDFILPDTEPAETRPEGEMEIVPSLDELDDDETKQDIPQEPSSLSDGEEDIVPPISSKTRRRLRKSGSDTAHSQSAVDHTSPARTPRRKSRAQRKKRSSNQVQLLQEEVEVVDLTQVDDSPVKNKADGTTREADDTTGDVDDIYTPPLNPSSPPEYSQTPHSVGGGKRLSKSPILLGGGNGDQAAQESSDQATQSSDLPDFGDLNGISKLSWRLLEERLDRRRLLIKSIIFLPDKDREGLRNILNKAPPSWFLQQVKLGLDALLMHKQRLRNLNEDQSLAIMRISSLYVSWVECKKLGKQGIPKGYIEKTQTELGGFNPFLELLLTGIDGYYNYYQTPKNQEEDDGLESYGSETGLGPVAKSTPHKKRKKAVKQSKEAMQTQQSAQQRVMVQQRQQSRLAKKLESMGVSNDDPERQAVSFDNPVVYLDPHIGRRVKPHQLSGIQFLWREIMTDEKGTGCLLAHTMGLGKTMQVISLLVTIANAGASTDPQIRRQVPKRLRKTQALILCPSSLIENWYEEFLMWTPQDSSTQQNIGAIRKIMSSPLMNVPQRFAEISAWEEEGGVLIMSYDLFRNFIQNNATKSKPPPLGEDTHERILKQLLDTPSIIVADEAHKMKNKDSGIAEVTSRFKSKSRIALTGSPLANNLGEYFYMINWISPGYLGGFIQFKAKYIEPIEDGLYSDSTSYERRKSLKKLQVLKEDVSPKVNRADISVIQSDLPPKVEFVITVPLTEIQKKCYNLYISSLLGDSGPSFGTANLWDWISILTLCCNHPVCFRNSILERRAKHNKKKEKNGPSSPEDSDFVRDMPGATVPELAANEQLRLLDGVSGPLESLEFSYRAMIVTQIIEESIKVGDKVLLFSQTLLTLDYMQSILKENGHKYSRLDGSTPMGTRQASTKQFNSKDSDTHVYLISTKAGGLGLNIPGANRVIIFDFSFNPTHEEQAVGRAYRIGQKKPVFVYRFLAGGTFEDIIYNKAIFKTQLSYRVVDKKSPIRWACKSPKDYLFHVKPVKQEDLSEFKGKDPRVLDKILARNNHIHGIGLTETFHVEDNDKLTEEEEKEAQEELDDERLKRNDPIAWERKNAEKMARETMQPYQPPNPNLPMQMGFLPAGNISYPTLRYAPPYAPPRPPFGQAPGSRPLQDPFVDRQRDGGPPPLAPDTSMHPKSVNTLNGQREASAAVVSGSSAMRNRSVVTPPQPASKKSSNPPNYDGPMSEGTLENNRDGPGSHRRHHTPGSQLRNDDENSKSTCKQQ